MPAESVVSSRDDTYTEDPLVGFNYRLDIGGQVAGYFTECSGIGSENDVVDHKVVDDTGHEIIRKIPGRLKWTDVTLKRGLTTDLEIWDWREKVVNGKMADARANCTIAMMNREYVEVAEWTFLNAWPSKVTGPSLKSDSNEYGVEEVTIVHEGMHRVT